MYNRPLCVFRTRNDFCLTGRRINSTGTDFGFPDSEYADDTAVLYESREHVVLHTPLLLTHFDRFGIEVHVGDISLPDIPSKTEILFVSAPSCYHNPNTFDNTDLSPIELGEGKFILYLLLIVFVTLEKLCLEIAETILTKSIVLNVLVMLLVP